MGREQPLAQLGRGADGELAGRAVVAAQGVEGFRSPLGAAATLAHGRLQAAEVADFRGELLPNGAEVDTALLVHWLKFGRLPPLTPTRKVAQTERKLRPGLHLGFSGRILEPTPSPRRERQPHATMNAKHEQQHKHGEVEKVRHIFPVVKGDRSRHDLRLRCQRAVNGGALLEVCAHAENRCIEACPGQAHVLGGDVSKQMRREVREDRLRKFGRRRHMRKDCIKGRPGKAQVVR
mmetsp:Transcript_876/g.2780  ORF Transcript_876/g.2780 Transcript_876/m.2780 type:complete len:235 (-) Transcript_876:165-869(-)